MSTPDPVSTVRTALTFTDADSERYANAALDDLLAEIKLAKTTIHGYAMRVTELESELESVGERDKAEIERLERVVRSYRRFADDAEEDGERDSRRIAQLTEALERIAVEISPSTLAAILSADQYVAALWEVVRHYSAIARAVLAGEEDARP